jgi:hypothetical protein
VAPPRPAEAAAAEAGAAEGSGQQGSGRTPQKAEKAAKGKEDKERQKEEKAAPGSAVRSTAQIPDDSELKNLTHAILGDEDDLQKQSEDDLQKQTSKVLRKIAEKKGLPVFLHHLHSARASSCSVTGSKSSNSCY